MQVHDVTKKLSYLLQEQGVTFENVIVVNFWKLVCYIGWYALDVYYKCVLIGVNVHIE